MDERNDYSSIPEQPIDRVTRFEVIDHTKKQRGRIVVEYGVKVEVSIQDEGRTMKVFLTDIGYREGYEQALRDVKAVLEPQESTGFLIESIIKEAVVSDTPAWSWMDDYREKYDKLLASGFFWEFHPTWSGVWEEDKYAFCHDRKYKKK